MIMTLFLLQAAASAPEGLPDIELNADVRARSVTIDKQGEASLKVTTEPEGGNLVDVRAPKANGQRTLRNVNVRVRAEARIGQPGQAPLNNRDGAETATPK